MRPPELREKHALQDNNSNEKKQRVENMPDERIKERLYLDIDGVLLGKTDDRVKLAKGA